MYGPFLSKTAFLSEDDEAQGNYGLWDVHLAFEWVQQNILEFGGSPTLVTAIGESAGAAITSHLMISPVMKGLLRGG